MDEGEKVNCPRCLQLNELFRGGRRRLPRERCKTRGPRTTCFQPTLNVPLPRGFRTLASFRKRVKKRWRKKELAALFQNSVYSSVRFLPFRPSPARKGRKEGQGDFVYPRADQAARIRECEPIASRDFAKERAAGFCWLARKVFAHLSRSVLEFRLETSYVCLPPPPRPSVPVPGSFSASKRPQSSFPLPL